VLPSASVSIVCPLVNYHMIPSAFVAATAKYIHHISKTIYMIMRQDLQTFGTPGLGSVSPCRDPSMPAASAVVLSCVY